MADEIKTGGSHVARIGSRAQVMHGTAHHTAGGLTKKALKVNKYGRIVSVRKSALAKKKGTLKKWEKKTGHKWTIKNGKPVKVKHGKKHRGGQDADEESSSDEEVVA
jgi:hypothetical protein